jgi:6-pyruvoyltetrahydropterin/6-carboxytetrahydropterin synthase
LKETRGARIATWGIPFRIEPAPVSDRSLYRTVDDKEPILIESATSPSPGRYRVLLQKEQLVFSAAHFITFAGDTCECLHGHNYGVKAEVVGPLDENQYVVDFIAFRDNLAQIVQQLDHHVLLPTQHPLIQVREDGQEVITSFREKRWVFPREDCMLLPIGNTTAEQIAWWIAHQLRAAMKPVVGELIETLEVAVDENHGQWGICTIDW